MKNIVRLQVERREFRPGGYRPVYKAKTQDGDDEIEVFALRLRSMIRDGRIVLSRLNRQQRALFERLGLGRETVNPKSVQERLTREARRQAVRTRGAARPAPRRRPPG